MKYSMLATTITVSPSDEIRHVRTDPLFERKEGSLGKTQ